MHPEKHTLLDDETTAFREPAGSDPVPNLLKELPASLRQKYPTTEARLLLEPVEALAHDAEFWDRPLDALAVLGGLGIFRASIARQVGSSSPTCAIRTSTTCSTT